MACPSLLEQKDGLTMRVRVQMEIAASPEDAFAYISDLSNNPEWQSGVSTTTCISDSPHDIGATYEQALDDGSVVVYFVADIEPGRSITMRTERGATVPATVTRTVQKLDVDRCRVRMELVGKVRGWRRVLTPLLRRLIRRSITSDYKRLRRILEPQTPAQD
jgi:uncharacterized membrane protein